MLASGVPYSDAKRTVEPLLKDITIRRLTSGDTDGFRSLRLEALKLFPNFYGTDYAEAVSATLSSFAQRISSGLLLGAFDGNLMVGCMAFDHEGGSKIEHRGWVTSFYVQPAYQKRGIGARLVEQTIERAYRAKLLQVELYVSQSNVVARRFYESHGFAVVGRSPRALRVNDTFFDELHMVRYLDA
ncbi:MAG: ribosomal protein S18 acetylase RimI-like enzyme [Paracoccaceae bacterium]